ncbi:MAG TPA: hypothetical protein VFC02_11130 [Anaerolineales bacterium]|nr:hypothetical protein [Anaerolineales bacterium]
MHDKNRVKKLIRSIFTVLAMAVILCVGIWILDAQTKFFRKIYDELILDNRNHYLPCDQLPSESEVRRVMEAHQDVIENIEQINPGFVGVEVDKSTCAGRADIIFWYGTHQDRLKIESIISDDTFYGIPYRLRNQ